MTSPVEVELKLELPAAALRQFRKLAWIRALAGSAKRSTPVSVYFDTDKQKLRRRGIIGHRPDQPDDTPGRLAPRVLLAVGFLGLRN